MSWDQVQANLAHLALASWLVALAVLPLGVLVGVALHGRWVSRHPTSDGRAPLDHPLAVRYYDVKALEARRGWLPASFTYSPHLRNEAPVLEPEALAAPNLPSLSLEDLLSGPGVTYGQDVATGQPVTDDRVRSLLVGGIPGSGKSTFVCLVVAQLVRRGAGVSLGDPHAGHPESLADRLAVLGIRPTVESEPRHILALVATAAQEIQARKVGHPAAHPVIVVVDELPEQIRLLGDRDRERLREALEVLGFSGRKFGVSIILLAQSWTRATIGGTAVRNLVPAAAIFRMRRDEALAMSGIRAESWPDDPLNLPPGEAYLVGVGSDIARIRVPALGARPVLGLPSSGARDGLNEHTMSTPRALSDDPKRAQILELARRGVELREIVRIVYGLERTGAAYTARMREVWAVVTGAVRGDA